MEEKKVRTRKTTGTVGAAAVELQKKALIAPSNTDVQLQTDAHLSEYEKNILETAQAFAVRNPHKDCFVIVLTKREKLLKNVMRNYFFSRFSCPTPDYDQAVFHFNHQTEDINLIWIIPDRKSSFHILDNILNNPPEMKEIVQYVLDFEDGTLLKKAKELNKEKLAVNPTLEIIKEPVL